jgi:hypothetical protein
MTRRLGETFISHSGWRLAHPDSDYDRLVYPERCAGNLAVVDIRADVFTVECDQCGYEVTTSDDRPLPDPDERIESSARDEEEAPF